jgi:hypothetical protein
MCRAEAVACSQHSYVLFSPIFSRFLDARCNAHVPAQIQTYLRCKLGGVLVFVTEITILTDIKQKQSVAALSEMLQSPEIALSWSPNHGCHEGIRKLDHESKSQPVRHTFAQTAGMSISRIWMLLLLGAMFVIRPGVALAAPCPAGLVVRQAAPGDLICVTPASRRRAAEDNARAPFRWVPGPFGPKTCAQGFVWR